MLSAIYLLAVLAFLLMNAFFALGEFAAVKIRPTRVKQLAEGGHPAGRALEHIKARLDEYLSVCQVGVTLSSIGLGFLGEPAIARLIQRGLDGALSAGAAHLGALGITYALVTYVSIVFAELIPKTLALTATERAALFAARPLRLCYTLFYVPLVALNRSASAILRVLGFRAASEGERLSEEEIRMALAESHKGGDLSFRQLLTIENVFIAGKLKVADAMKPRAQARALVAEAPWESNLRVVTESRYSRFPLLEAGARLPTGIIHVKDLYYARRDPEGADELRRLARPCARVREDQPLQDAMVELQKRRVHWALVVDAAGEWTGFLTLEDVMEEVVGAVEDEFEVDPPVHLADALSPGRVVLGLSAGSVEELIRKAFDGIPRGELPRSPDGLADAVVSRERLMPTYLGRGLAVPHARIDGLEKPLLVFAQSVSGVPVPGRSERARIFFIVLTSTSNPRDQARLLARIGGILDSELVERQLKEGRTREEVLEAVRSGELALLG